MAKRENKEDRTKAQLEAFVEAARALECDESEERFDETLKKVAQHKPRDNADDDSDSIEDKQPSK